jgi:hypothetical protein
MQFLSPWYIPALAAVLTVPPLVIMYFLRLRRRETPVPTTYLWRKVIEDLQVNQPFQKLRKNLLLLLQLLVLFAAIFALAKPIHKMASSQDERIVLMIDRSASMNVREGRATRLEQAKDQAQALLRGMRRSQKVMLVAFADTAEVLCPFTADKGQLAERVRSIAPSDRTTHLDEAVRLAQAYATPLSGPEGDGPRNQMVSTEPPGKAVIFSDGAIADSSQIRPGRLNLEYVKIGSADNNIGITAIQARREYDNPQRIQLFLRVQNFSPRDPAITSVAIYVNDVLAAAKDLDLPATPPPAAEGETEEGGSPQASRMQGSQTVAFDLLSADAVVIEARLQTDDALKADNTARVCLGPARQSSVLLVTTGNIFLEKVLAGLPLRQVAQMKPEQYGSAGAKATDFDVTIFDGYAPPQLGEGNFIFFAAAPTLPGFAIEVPPRDAPSGDDTWRGTVVDFDTAHPMMRHVSVDEILVARWCRMQVPRGASILLETDKGPGIVYAPQTRRQMVLVGFRLSDSLWPLQVGFPVFMYNTIRYMTGSVMQAEQALTPGQPMDIAAPRDLKTLTIVAPDRTTWKIDTAAAGQGRFAATEQAGLYHVEPRVSGVVPQTFAVNLTDANESDIAPRRLLQVGGVKVAVQASQEGANQPIWPYAILGALAILCLEWYIYNRRVMV